eukprot:9454761-Pyramimonas_sp.AAC.1
MYDLQEHFPDLAAEVMQLCARAASRRLYRELVGPVFKVEEFTKNTHFSVSPVLKHAFAAGEESCGLRANLSSNGFHTIAEGLEVVEFLPVRIL